MSYKPPDAPSSCVAFGPFQLHVRERRLTSDGQPVQIGSRALDILIALVENAGNVVTKRELGRRAWSGIVVEDSTLRVHIANLRKALEDGRNGARYIVNVTGRGYCFVADTTAIDARVTDDATSHANMTTNSADQIHVMAARLEEVLSAAVELLARLSSNSHIPGVAGEMFSAFNAPGAKRFRTSE